ncbi:uncharacterized protein BT62DRAFT_1009662 [Guyanagaster necrorhizus]|uniref:Uncharacterized protein n=1 Tax=Guyanagaster necrorhizus TaxID=856835 RepID=A0A9P8APL0_9AGAR|nr:uncharacterized protein BT62DRAFT_1009662 [Guyanagaster necrorhizus MCA 3950]KAG7443060.1 hypothetical protein BT62DRAFT_1009662 [Guyanagaster necrorhizus MCA 3950]
MPFLDDGQIWTVSFLVRPLGLLCYMASSSQATEPTAASSSSSSGGGGGGGGTAGQDTSSSLYLFTFLATLFLLLIISSSIILRTFVMRRRLQRHMEEAMAQGVILAPHNQGSRKKRLGRKPKMYEAWIVPGHGADTWEDMMPLSAQPIRRLKPSSDPVVADRLAREHAMDARLRHFVRWDFREPDTRLPEPEVPKVYVIDSQNPILQVSVLIAMPSPRYPSCSSYDDEIPEIVVGVARRPYILEADAEQTPC